MPNTPEGFGSREYRDIAKQQENREEKAEKLDPLEAARSKMGKAKDVSEKQKKEEEIAMLLTGELDAKVHESALKYGTRNEMMQPDQPINLAARVTPGRFSDIPYPTNDDIDFTDKVINQKAGTVNPYENAHTATSSKESQEAAPEGSLRNLYDMMRTKPTILGISSVARFEREIQLDTTDNQIVLSPSVMMKLASLANKHGDAFLQMIGREQTGRTPHFDGSGFIEAHKAGKATAEWKNFVDTISKSRSRKS